MSIKELEAKINKNSLTLCIGFGLITIVLFIVIWVHANRIDSMGEKLERVTKELDAGHTYNYANSEISSHTEKGGIIFFSEWRERVYNDDAIMAIMNHLGLEFKYIPEKPSNVVVSKKGEK